MALQLAKWEIQLMSCDASGVGTPNITTKRWFGQFAR